MLAPDVRREPRFVLSEMVATLSELAVPVKLAGEVVAVINVESDQVGDFDGSDLFAVDAIASQVASAIRNARLFDEKVRALRTLEIVQEITNDLNSHLEEGELLARIAPPLGGGRAACPPRGGPALRRRGADRALQPRLGCSRRRSTACASPSTRASRARSS